MGKRGVMAAALLALVVGLTGADDDDGGITTTNRTMTCTISPAGFPTIPSGKATVWGDYNSSSADMEKMVLAMLKVEYISGSRVTTSLASKSFTYASPGVASKNENYLFSSSQRGITVCGTADAEGAAGVSLMGGAGTSIEVTLY